MVKDTNVIPLFLTEDEAMALLDICLLSEAEQDPVRERAMSRVSTVCREFIRAEARYAACSGHSSRGCYNAAE